MTNQIVVKGTGMFDVPFEAKINITQERWDALGEEAREVLIESSVRWSMKDAKYAGVDAEQTTVSEVE